MGIKYQQVSKQTQTQSDPYYEADSQRQLADALAQAANKPRDFGTASSGQANVQGLTQIAQALLARYADKQAEGTLGAADAQTKAQNDASLESLSPSTYNPVDRPPTVMESLGPNDPATPLAGTEHVGPAMVNNQHSALVSALAGMDPRMVRSFLSQQQIARALPPVQQPFNLGPGEKRFDSQGRVIANNPKEQPLKKFQKTDSGLNYDDTTGTYTDSAGNVLSSAQVAAREAAVSGQKAAATSAAQNQAKLNALPKDSMDYWVEWSKQNGGAAPPGSRSAQFLARFGEAMKADALSRGDTIAATVADSRLKKSLGPAMEQTNKQYAANKGFYDTLHKNINSANALEQKLGGTNSPLLNRAYQKWKTGVTGDPETAPIISALNIWNNAIQGEAAKIASGGVGSVSPGSDTQIAKQVQLLSTAQNYPTWRTAADAMLQEGGNRMSSITGTLDDLRAQSSGAPRAEVAATGPTKISSDAEYNALPSGTEFIAPDGSHRKKP